MTIYKYPTATIYTIGRYRITFHSSCWFFRLGCHLALPGTHGIYDIEGECQFGKWELRLVRFSKDYMKNYFVLDNIQTETYLIDTFGQKAVKAIK